MSVPYLHAYELLLLGLRAQGSMCYVVAVISSSLSPPSQQFKLCSRVAVKPLPEAWYSSPSRAGSAPSQQFAETGLTRSHRLSSGGADRADIIILDMRAESPVPNTVLSTSAPERLVASRQECYPWVHLRKGAGRKKKSRPRGKGKTQRCSQPVLELWCEVGDRRLHVARSDGGPVERLHVGHSGRPLGLDA
jgi:hypothetical protein